MQWVGLLCLAAIGAYCAHENAQQPLPAHKALIDELFPSSKFSVACRWNPKAQGTGVCEISMLQGGGIPPDLSQGKWRRVARDRVEPQVWCNGAYVLTVHAPGASGRFNVGISRFDKVVPAIRTPDQALCAKVYPPST